MSLSKYNNWLAHKHVATTCCTDHEGKSFTHDHWALKKAKTVFKNVPEISKDMQKDLNLKLYTLNNFIKDENALKQAGFISNAQTVDLGRDTLSKKVHIPKSKVRKLYPNSSQHNNKHITYKMNDKILVDGIHPQACIKFKWLDNIFESCEKESSECYKMLNEILPPTNPDNDLHAEHYVLSASICSFSKMSIYYNYFNKIESKTFFDTINNCDAKWEQVGSRECLYMSPFPYRYGTKTHPAQVNCHPIITEMINRLKSSLDQSLPYKEQLLYCLV